MTSSRTPLARLALPSLIALVSFASVACSGPSNTPTPIGDGTLDEQAAERLLTKSDIAGVGGSTSGLDRTAEDILAVAALVGLAQIEGVEVWFSVRFAGDGRPGLLLSIKRFDDVDGALAALDRLTLGGAYTATEPAVGDRSAISPLNPSIGAALSFVVGRTLITLQLSVTTDGVTLLDDAGLVALAEQVASRL